MTWQICLGIFLALPHFADSRLRGSPTAHRSSLASSKHEEFLAGVHTLSWAPSSDAKGMLRSSVKGTFLLLHGCGHHASDFYALPEESKIAAAVLDRGFILLAPDATPTPGQCWEPTHDGPLVRDALHEFLKSRHLQNQPVYGIGISNGGALLEYMFSVLNVDFAGLHFNVGPAASHPESNVWGLFRSKKHPPVTFVHMLHDRYTPQQKVQEAVAYLRQMHTPVQELQVAPLALGYLVAQADQIGMNEHLLDSIVQKMIDWGYTEMRPGVMSQSRLDPKHVPVAFKTAEYRRYLKLGFAPEAVKKLSNDSQLGTLLKAHLAAFAEELHLVEGWHCPTAEHIGQSLDFLLKFNRTVN